MNFQALIQELNQTIRNNNVDLVKTIINRLLAQGFKLNSIYDDLNPLLSAVKLGNLEIIALLIQKEAKFNSFYEDLNPLMLAVKLGNVKIVKLLIEGGADVNLQMEDESDTALMIAAVHGHFEIVKTLVKSGADINLEDCYGAKAVAMAASNGHEDVYNYLAPLTVPEYDPGAKLLAEAKRRKRKRNEKGLWVYKQ